MLNKRISAACFLKFSQANKILFNGKVMNFMSGDLTD
jgi:hypothetical protein